MSDLSALFLHPLIDLGTVEDQAFKRVLTPEPEVGQPKLGVDEVFLGQAESYYEKFQSFDYWRSLISTAVKRLGLPEPEIVVEFGCGFGNSTLPVLDLFPRSKVVATDISPNLLAILRGLLDSRSLGDRCLPVAMDAQKPYIREGVADLVLGSAILHHLTKPGAFVQQAMRLLKPGGAALFFEPMEAGYALLREACLLAAAEGVRRGEGSEITDIARSVADGLLPQLRRQRIPGWEDRNDKWAFPRSVLAEIADAANADLVVYPINNLEAPFRSHIAYVVEAASGRARETIPDWFYASFDHLDCDVFSPEMLLDLPIEACVIFRPRAQIAIEARSAPEKTPSSMRAWQAASQTYRRYLSSLDPSSIRSPRPVHLRDRPEPKPALDRWITFDNLATLLPTYAPTFFGPTTSHGYINSSHAEIASAPSGRMGLAFLIDLGIDGFLLHEDALKLYEMTFFADGDVLEIGTHQGLSTSIMAKALQDRGSGFLNTVDIDSTVQSRARQTMASRPEGVRVIFNVNDATAHLDQLVSLKKRFGFAFVDHWHGYDATREVAMRLGSVLNPGGFALFHDYINADNSDLDHVYGVYQALLDSLAADPEWLFYGNFGCCGLWRRLV